ncbi:cation-translocating P-type ATPase [Chloroflexota bacterium]
MAVWHKLSPDEALAELESKHDGLDQAEAVQRQKQHGLNVLLGKPKPPAILIFLKQFLSPLIYVLLAAVILSLVLHHYIDSAVILGVLLLNAAIGYIQESRAEKAMEALLKSAAPKAKVKRNGKITLLPARQLVPGDIILLETGDKVPADARLIEISNLKINESTLTGESMPVDKHIRALTADAPLAERKNLVHMSTIITYGRATAVVTTTGMNTEIGRIATVIAEVETPKTPLQKSIGKLSRYIVFIFLGICAILIGVGIARGLPALDVFLVAVAAAVSAIPEGLPAVVTVVLAIGMHKMANRKAIIRKLAAVETLGSATVICSDKTGTLTLNEMTVHNLYLDGGWIEVSGDGYEPVGDFKQGDATISASDNENLALMLKIGALCNDAMLVKEDGESGIYGDPTEGSLVVAAAKAGLDKETLDKRYPRIDEIPFQSEKLYMATLHRDEQRNVAYAKGAPERLLAMSKSIIKGDSVQPITKSDIEEISDANTRMAKQAMRVIATAYVEFPPEMDDIEDPHLQGALTFVGLMGMADPPRDEAREAIKLCNGAGIRVVMITGDNVITAQSIAEKIGLPAGRAVTGSDLHQMSDEELFDQVEDISVFARIEPLQKLKIVNALKGHDHVVAMTGDGVNDAPALKTANIGIAMGITGTDVAKESSDMVLADDNFASVVAAVDEGRAIFNRLRNVVFFSLSTNLSELLSLILAISIIGVAPLLAVQIIWINLVTDTSVEIPLGLEPKFGDELKQPPRHPRVGLIYPGLLLRICFLALLMSLAVFFIFQWAESRYSVEEARTLAFCAIATFSWLRVLNARSDEHTIFKLGIFKNKWLLIGITTAVLLQMVVIYAPFMQDAFKTAPLSIEQWGIVLLAGVILFVIEEARKVLLPNLFAMGKFMPFSKKLATTDTGGQK